MVLLVYALVLVALYLVPLTFNCPCIMDRHSLKPRPDIIGRRGAPMVSWCFARPHCLIQLIVQIDVAALWEELRVVSAKTCQVSISCWFFGYKCTNIILENFLLPQHPVLMDQMVHFYIRRLSVSTPLHYSIFHTAVWCSAAAHELTVIRLSKHESRQHPELPSHSWASKYCSR